jgi:hypothetical protein
MVAKKLQNVRLALQVSKSRSLFSFRCYPVLAVHDASTGITLMTKSMLFVSATLAFIVMAPVHAEIPNTPTSPSCNTAACKTTTVAELGLWLPLGLGLSVLGGKLGLSAFLRASRILRPLSLS